jgi:hypothetical protein
VWRYNEENRCQRLAGFQALRRSCHDVKHILFASDDERRIELLRYFIAVNRIGPEEAEAYLQAARQQQQRFNQRQWTINYGAYNWQMPPLAGLNQRQAFVKCMGSRYSETRKCY